MKTTRRIVLVAVLAEGRDRVVVRVDDLDAELAEVGEEDPA